MDTKFAVDNSISKIARVAEILIREDRTNESMQTQLISTTAEYVNNNFKIKQVSNARISQYKIYTRLGTGLYELIIIKEATAFNLPFKSISAGSMITAAQRFIQRAPLNSITSRYVTDVQDDVDSNILSSEPGNGNAVPKITNTFRVLPNDIFDHFEDDYVKEILRGRTDFFDRKFGKIDMPVLSTDLFSNVVKKEAFSNNMIYVILVSSDFANSYIHNKLTSTSIILNYRSYGNNISKFSIGNLSKGSTDSLASYERNLSNQNEAFSAAFNELFNIGIVEYTPRFDALYTLDEAQSFLQSNVIKNEPTIFAERLKRYNDFTTKFRFFTPNELHQMSPEVLFDYATDQSVKNDIHIAMDVLQFKNIDSLPAFDDFIEDLCDQFLYELQWVLFLNYRDFRKDDHIDENLYNWLTENKYDVNVVKTNPLKAVFNIMYNLFSRGSIQKLREFKLLPLFGMSIGELNIQNVIASRMVGNINYRMADLIEVNNDSTLNLTSQVNKYLQNLVRTVHGDNSHDRTEDSVIMLAIHSEIVRRARNIIALSL